MQARRFGPGAQEGAARTRRFTFGLWWGKQAVSKLMAKRLYLLLPLLLLAGCAARFTNLTPAQALRNETHLYPFEVALESSQQTMVWSTIQPYVVIGSETYPMRPTPLVGNRWEALIPIPASVRQATYFYKFDYQVNSLGPRKPTSAVSQGYALRFLDNP
jgi:hypothetical protein